MVSRMRAGIGEEPVEQRAEENDASTDDDDGVDAEGEVRSHGLKPVVVSLTRLLKALSMGIGETSRDRAEFPGGLLKLSWSVSLCYQT